MPSRLDDLMAQIRDPARWPPVPEPQLQPLTEEDWRPMILSEEDLRRALRPAWERQRQVCEVPSGDVTLSLRSTRECHLIWRTLWR
jgi:hypothetical protein